MDYRDVCKKEIWFVLADRKREGRRFLRWAKALGCVWLNGRPIDPRAGTDFFVVAMTPQGKIGYVPAIARASKQFREIERVRFSDVPKMRS